MFETDPQFQPESVDLTFETAGLLHDSLSWVQGAPEGRDNFAKSNPAIQNMYYEGLKDMGKMQALLGVTEHQVGNPMTIAGEAYSRRAVVECALHTIAASPILAISEKCAFLNSWIEQVAGPKRTFLTQLQARMAATESLWDLFESHQIPDARILAQGSENVLEGLNGYKVVKLGKQLGNMLVRKEK